MAPSSSSSRVSCRAGFCRFSSRGRPAVILRAAMLIEARDVTKAFGAFKAVDNASVAVEEGEILGLIGPNGAGKSTFFNCLTGDLPPTSGTVHFNNANVTGLPPEARA